MLLKIKERGKVDWSTGKVRESTYMLGIGVWKLFLLIGRNYCVEHTCIVNNYCF